MSTSEPLPQGDLRLLDTPAARTLLARPIPARLGYVSRDGTPRVVPTWFHWNGRELVLPTFVSGPQVRHPARRLRDLRERPAVAVSIDTDHAPPTVLSIRGQASVYEVAGIAEEYALCAERYLGEPGATELLARYAGDGLTMARVVVVPSWVGLIDFERRLPGPVGGVMSG